MILQKIVINMTNKLISIENGLTKPYPITVYRYIVQLEFYLKIWRKGYYIDYCYNSILQYVYDSNVFEVKEGWLGTHYTTK